MYVLSDDVISYTESITKEIEEKDLNERLRKLNTERMFEEIWKKLLVNIKGTEHVVQFPVSSFGEGEFGIPGYLTDFAYLEKLLSDFGCEFDISKVEKYSSEKTAASYLSEIMTVKTTFQNIKSMLEKQKKEAFERKNSFF